MARTHPPALLTLVARALRGECALPAGTRVLVATSGGPDSQALLHALSVAAPRFRLVLAAHGVDHGLRRDASAELDLAEDLAARVGVPFTRSRVRVGSGGNLMARARTARYASLRAAAKAAGASVIATAHHADDRAETVLLRLLRGSGARGLAALPPRDADLVRPLVRARRTDVQAHVRRHRLPFASDPSNQDRRFLRARVRFELIPLLESLSPGIVGHLEALADQLGAGADGSFGPETWLGLGRAHVEALRRLVQSGSRRARVALPGGREARLDDHGGILMEIAPPRGQRRLGAAKRPKSD